MTLKAAGGVKKTKYHKWLRRRWEQRARAAAERRKEARS